MRSIWTGTLSFGLVNIPVRLYTATEPQSLDLDMLHKKDLSPVRYARVCRADGHEVPYQEIVKGYQVQKGDYVVLDAEDFKKANARKSNTIEILRFVKEAEIETFYFEKPYYLEPDRGGDNAYALLREALRKAKKVGVAKFVMKNREHLAAVKPEDDVIVLNTLRFQSEIRRPNLNLPSKTVKPKELEMALQLIDQLTEPFRPAEYHDTYTEELKHVIEEKARGKVPESKGRESVPTKVPDLMAALRSSLERSREHRDQKEKVKVRS